MQRKLLRNNRIDSPYVLLDPSEGYGEITGKSFPPDVSEFYNPLIEWFDFFKFELKKEFELNIKFEYINTASLKSLMLVMYKLEELVREGKSILIKWFYPDDDEEMLEIGEEFSNIVKMEFQYIAYTRKN